MTFRAPTVSPPITLFIGIPKSGVKIETPLPPFPSAFWPLASVPMKFPCTVLFPLEKIATPSEMFPEIRFPSPCPLPPTLLLFASIRTPHLFGSAAVPRRDSKPHYWQV